MNGTSKCGQCMHKDSCQIRLQLSDIVKEVIKNAESEVQRLAPREIDYMIVTDIALIPTRCQNYARRNDNGDLVKEKDRLFFLDRGLAPSAV